MYECLKLERVYWAWSGEQWMVVLGRTSLEFRARQRPRVCQGVRVEIAAVAYLYGWFRDVVALGGFKRFDLARRMFGLAAIEAARERVIAPLQQWGYTGRTAMLSCLCEALLRNESPHPEYLSAETLERFREGVSACRRSHYYQLAKGLSIAGILGRPLSIAPPRKPTIRDDIGNGVAPEWCEWVERWNTDLDPRDPQPHPAASVQDRSLARGPSSRDRLAGAVDTRARRALRRCSDPYARR